MPDICFHFSSETADAAGHCPGGDRTRITMPIEPALQIPNTAKPTCYLHNLAFTNAIANCLSRDGSNKLALQVGRASGKYKSRGQSPWIGFTYRFKGKDPNGVAINTEMTLVAPLTSEHGLMAAPYNVQNLQTSDQAAVNINWANMKSTLDDMPVPRIYDEINKCFYTALNSATYAKATRQDMVFTTHRTAAYGSVTDPILAMCALPGSTNRGILMYTGSTKIHDGFTNDAAPYTGLFDSVFATLDDALARQDFQLMSSAEINTWINAHYLSGYTGTAYSNAYSIFDALGGGPLTPTNPDPAHHWYDYNSFGGDMLYQNLPGDPAATTPGMELVSTSKQIVIPEAAYELTDMETAFAELVKADSTFHTAINSHMPTNTLLADPDDADQWASAGTKSSDGKTYVKVVELIGNTVLNRCQVRCAPQVSIEAVSGQISSAQAGDLFSTVLGFDPVQLTVHGIGPMLVTANNAARVDRTRDIVFHAPTLAAGSYSTAGKRGGSAIAMIPVTAPVGEVQAWEARVPVQVPAQIAGSSLSNITVFLSNEDGERISLLADRWSAQLILSF